MIRILERSLACAVFVAATLGLVTVPAAPADAQGLGWGGGSGSVGFGSQPYNFRAPSATGGAGMSLAYRQAILDAKIDNRRPRNLVRGADGLLLDVERRDGQAFVRARSAPLIPGQAFGRGSGGIAVGGFGLGGGAITAWIGQVQRGIFDVSQVDVGIDPRFAYHAGYHAIDEWIALL